MNWAAKWKRSDRTPKLKGQDAFIEQFIQPQFNFGEETADKWPEQQNIFAPPYSQLTLGLFYKARPHLHMVKCG